MKKGKVVKGKNFVTADEVYDKKQIKKDSKGMKTAGLSLELKESQSQQGYSDKPRVKPQKKLKKIVHGQKKAN
jgi:hypothetical protein